MSGPRRKLSREMERALSELHDWPSAERCTLIRFVSSRTLVGWSTVRSLVTRGLVEIEKPEGEDAAVFTLVRLTEAGKPIAERAWRERHPAQAAAVDGFFRRVRP